MDFKIKLELRLQSGKPDFKEVAMLTYQETTLEGRNGKETNERGALMVEAIALLGLMTLMSPMVVRQTADRTAEMEEVAVAGQMKEVKDALNNWIAAHYSDEAKKIQTSALNAKISVNAADLAPYLAASALTSENGSVLFRGNKLIDDFKVGVRAECTELMYTNGQYAPLTNGLVTATPSASQPCRRYRMTGVVLSDSGANEIDDRRAARIASMIGAEGGSMRTSKFINALGGNTATEMKKILGAQGIWEGNIDNYFASGVNSSVGGRVAATTVYSSGFTGDYLYRRKVDGMPDANSMFTNLDMGGGSNCTTDGCHKINNAGGLEVVGGKILIRSANNAANDKDQEIGTASDSFYARIALGTDNAIMNVTGNVNLSSTNKTALNLNSTTAFLNGNGSTVTLNNTWANMKGANVKIAGNMSDLTMYENGGVSLGAAKYISAYTDTGSLTIDNSGTASLSASTNARLFTANSKLDLNNTTAFLNGNGSTLNLNSSTAFLNGNGSTLNLNNSTAAIVGVNSKLTLNGTTAFLNGNGSTVNLNNSTAEMVGVNSKLTLNGTNAFLNGNGSTLNMNDTVVKLAADGNNYLSMNKSSGKIMLESYTETEVRSEYALTTWNDGGVMYSSAAEKIEMGGGSSGSKMVLNTNQARIGLNGASLALFNNQKARIDANEIVLDADYGSLYVNDGHIVANAMGGIKLQMMANTAQMVMNNGGMYLNGQGTMLNMTSGQVNMLINNSTTFLNMSKTDVMMGANGTFLRIDNNGAYVQSGYYSGAAAVFNVDTRTASISAGYFQPDFVHNVGNQMVGPVRQRKLLAYNSATGYLTEGSANSGQWGCVNLRNFANDHRNAAVLINYDAESSTTATSGNTFSQAAYKNHTDDLYKYNRFRVDPAFTSVMNDIKLTSRGGARLSEALPNYILKGIYVLTNSYGSGGWPCGIIGSCEFVMPKFTLDQMGLSAGGWEHRCTQSHPIIKGGGYCYTRTEHIEFDYSKNNSGTAYGRGTYTSCPANKECWAHPYMGRVPAPGYFMEDATRGNIYAADEGNCPDGYQAVMTVTPTLFEAGRVISYNSQALPGNAIMQYNPGYMNYAKTGMRDATSIVQPSTQVGLTVGLVDNNKPASSGGLAGWDVAMGTITPDSDATSGFIWNVGGIPANSWSATVHTYCYYNPSRFLMPNMKIQEQGGNSYNKNIVPMENPMLSNATLRGYMGDRTLNN